jgi:hypothetical protein
MLVTPITIKTAMKMAIPSMYPVHGVKSLTQKKKKKKKKKKKSW